MKLGTKISLTKLKILKELVTAMKDIPKILMNHESSPLCPVISICGMFTYDIAKYFNICLLLYCILLLLNIIMKPYTNFLT